MNERLQMNSAAFPRMLAGTAVVLGWLAAHAVAGDAPFAPYAERALFQLAPSGAWGSGMHGYANPALLNYVDGAASTVAWSAGGDDWASFNALGRLGLGQTHRRLPGKDRDEFRLGLGLGDRLFGLGLGYGRSDPGTGHGVLGALWRPSPRLSVGAVLSSDFSFDAREGVLDLGVRPWGGNGLTLFADLAVSGGRAGSGRFWSGGAVFGLLPGLEAVGRYFKGGDVSLGLHLGLGNWGLAGKGVAKEEAGAGRRGLNAVEWRRGGGDLLAGLKGRSRQYLRLDLKGGLPYRRAALFDKGPTLSGVLRLLDRARRDPDIAGVALNLSGMAANPAAAWEVRQKLAQVRRAGKGVVVYIDRVRLWGYYFASVADHVVLDPQGIVALEGFVAGTTYYSGALEKLGVGFEEWRYFDYKSAMEPFVRSGMSPAERRQTQALLDDLYTLVREGVYEARGIEPAAFDRLVDDQTLFMARAALEAGLVDAIGRWEEVEKGAANLAGGAVQWCPEESYRPAAPVVWGQWPRVAVVYATGVCALDNGIRARQLAPLLEGLGEDPRVAAVVLRVDSPGGDALAADLVAAALLRLRQSKPVVVSQGYVAASGGYWLSMYADAIVAAPLTVTGSIGVIGGWVYDSGLKGRLGLATDKVQVGEHADLAFGMWLPLLGLRLPDRNLNDAERARQEHAIRALYGDFVAQVAAGRGRPVDEVENLAQGRVWSGVAAVDNGLVDEIGGLERAVQLAAAKAGLEPDTRVEWVEMPGRPLFNRQALSPALLGSELSSPRLPPTLEFRLRRSGEPLVLLPLDFAAGLGLFE